MELEELLKVERNSLIAGQKIKTVRDMLRDLSDRDYFTVEHVESHLYKRIWSDHVDELVRRGIIAPNQRSFYKANERVINSGKRFGKASGARRIPDQTTAAQALIDQLLMDGMVELRQGDDRPRYKTTTKGNALALTDFVPRMNRPKAEKLLTGVLERVAAINSRDDLLHWVAEVRVFGSYLTDTADLGDVDLAIKLERRPAGETGGYAWAEACLEMARRSGKKFGSYLDELTYPERLVWRMIKNRSPYISLHGTDELDRNPDMGGKTIYTFVPPKTRG
jgi:predicted nucleotidyltransferase